MIRKAIQHKVYISHHPWQGEGVLKEEVRILLRKYNVEVNDGNYSKYGLGACTSTLLLNYFDFLLIKSFI